jgi:uncharacterized protein
MDDVRMMIQDALKQAMLNKDTMRRDVLRMTQSAFKQIEIDERRELSADDAMTVLQKEIKKRRESVEDARRAGREDIAAAEAEQLAVLEVFLPQQMTRDEIETVVRSVVSETGATSAKDMGRVMAALMPKVKGRADGRLVNEVVKAVLGG